MAAQTISTDIIYRANLLGGHDTERKMKKMVDAEKGLIRTEETLTKKFKDGSRKKE